MLPPSGDSHIWLEMEGLLRPQVAAVDNPRPYPSELDRFGWNMDAVKYNA